MRELTGHRVNPANDTLKITVLDEPGAGGANHEYVVVLPNGSHFPINFQKGPIPEHGVNGITQEALIEICIDRLQAFQKGPFACRENALALTNLEQAQMWLQKRTLDRMRRGVEGTLKT